MIKFKAGVLLFLLIITFIVSLPPFIVAWIILQPTKIALDIQLKWYNKIKNELNG
jgi:hypothetical protein